MTAPKIKVRIALAVDREGNWSATGWGGPLWGKQPTPDEQMLIACDLLAEGHTTQWIDIEVPMPTLETPDPGNDLDACEQRRVWAVPC